MQSTFVDYCFALTCEKRCGSGRDMLEIILEKYTITSWIVVIISLSIEVTVRQTEKRVHERPLQAELSQTPVYLLGEQNDEWIVGLINAEICRNAQNSLINGDVNQNNK